MFGWTPVPSITVPVTGSGGATIDTMKMAVLTMVTINPANVHRFFMVSLFLSIMKPFLQPEL
jgi:hypothetical protein